MTELDEALENIAVIRHQMARDSEFRGYGPATLATTGVLAILAAGAQAWWLKDPASAPGSYLILWVATAAVSAALVGIETVTRSRRVHSGLADEMIWAVVEQFLPSAAAGALLTVVLWRFAPATLWMLPGLWQIVFSLGVFASRRFLPRPVFLIGVWYLATGLACLAFAGGAAAFSAWAMGTPFGLGQLLVAAVLRHDLRRAADHG